MSLSRSCFPDEKEFTSDAETDCKPPKTEPVSDAEEGNTGAPCQLKADCFGCGEDQPNKTSAEVWPVIDELHLDNKDHQVFTTPSASPAASDDDDDNDKFSLPPADQTGEEPLPADTAADKDLVPAPCTLCASDVMLITRKLTNAERPIVDFRLLNTRILRRNTATPLLSDIFQILGNSKFELLSCIDLKDAFHSLEA